MIETVIERHYHDRMKSLRQIALATDGNGAKPWQFFEDVADVCVELSRSGCALFEQELKQLFRETNLTIDWLRERRAIMEALSDDYVKLAEAIRDAVMTAGTIDSPRRNAIAGRIDGALRTLVAVKVRVLERWLVGTDEEESAAAAAAARGEGMDIDDAFAELAGVDVITWRQRIADYKASQER